MITLLDLFPFSDTKLESVRAFSGLVTDPRNAHELAESFAFDREKSEAVRLAQR